MKIVRAIQVLILDKACEFEGDVTELEEAHQLGIEALKRVDNDRIGLHEDEIKLLHGETKS